MSAHRHRVNHHADDDLRQVAEDDALLEALARRDDLPLSAGDRDDVTTLLRALTVDVDTHAERAVSRPAVRPAVSLLPATDQRPHSMRVGRSTAALALLAAIVAGGTGVAAAVTGDPLAGLAGLQRVIGAATSGDAEPPTPVPTPSSSTGPAHPGVPGAAPGVPGATPGVHGGTPAGTPAGTVTYAVPPGPAATAGRKPEAPGAVLPTSSPRQAAPLSSASAPGSTGAESVRRHQQPTQEPTASAAQRSEPAKPTRSPAAAVGRGDRDATDPAPEPDPGRPDVSSSSRPGSAPGTGVRRSPGPRSDGD